MKIYDKVGWHYPDGEGCSSLQEAQYPFQKLMDWLASKELLSEEGKEFQDVSRSGEDFSVNEKLVVPKGQKLLDECYDEWAKKESSYSGTISFQVLEDGLEQIS